MKYKMTQEQYKRIDIAFKILIERQKTIFNFLDKIGKKYDCVRDSMLTKKQRKKFFYLRYNYYHQIFVICWEIDRIMHQDDTEKEKKLKEYINILNDMEVHECHIENIHNDIIAD